MMCSLPKISPLCLGSGSQVWSRIYRVHKKEDKCQRIIAASIPFQFLQYLLFLFDIFICILLPFHNFFSLILGKSATRIIIFLMVSDPNRLSGCDR
ncbi:hypothetical protein I7I53_07535 [Histoplasma capsulatum var. duboisii H88]|uniref:Uncharacterized protein n=1 Tax=Ajellomyces capsulatus (strain H88) TaxID=544711 RepID=A0A8A1LJP0_AJEC8|nr:hypothetical protein I7I53_07535 [Histoplasma capsulatum var. duboisii H88]